LKIISVIVYDNIIITIFVKHKRIISCLTYRNKKEKKEKEKVINFFIKKITMEDLIIERVDFEIEGKLDNNGDCVIWADGSAYLNKEEVQQVIDHLKLLLKG